MQQEALDGLKRSMSDLKAQAIALRNRIKDKEAWISNARRKMEQLENRKSANAVEWELQRMRPLLDKVRCAACAVRAALPPTRRRAMQAQVQEASLTSEQQKWRTNREALESKAEVRVLAVLMSRSSCQQRTLVWCAGWCAVAHRRR